MDKFLAILKGNIKSKLSWLGGALVGAGSLMELAPDFVTNVLPLLLKVAPAEYGETLNYIGLAIIALRNVTSKSITEKALPAGPVQPKQINGGFALPALLVQLTAIGLLALLLGGCGAFKWIEENPNTASLAFEGVTVAVLKDASDQQALAREIIEEIDRVEVALNSTEPVAVADLARKAKERIAASERDVGEILLLNRLVDRAQVELEKLIIDGTVNPDDKATVGQVLGWIEGVAVLYAR